MTSKPQQNGNIPSTSSSTSSSKPPPKLNILEQAGVTRADLLAAFPTVIEVDSSHPGAIRCLTCKRSIIAYNKTTVLIKHFKTNKHIRLQNALDSSLSPGANSSLLPISPPDVCKSVFTVPPSAVYAKPPPPPLQQQPEDHNYHNRSFVVSRPPLLNLDEQGISRVQLLTAFAGIIEVDSSRPPTDRAIRCLTCAKSIKADSPTDITRHLKSASHAVRQKALESGLSPGQYEILSKYPAGIFRPLGDNLIQCLSCKVNFTNISEKVVRNHLECDLHARSRTTRAEHEKVEQMGKKEFERLFTQTFFIDCGIAFHKFEKGRKVFEAMLGRTLPTDSMFRKMVKGMKAATEEKEDPLLEGKKRKRGGEKGKSEGKQKKPKGAAAGGQGERGKYNYEGERVYEQLEAHRALENIQFY